MNHSIYILLLLLFVGCNEKPTEEHIVTLDINAPKKPVQLENEVELNGFNISDSFDLDLFIEKNGEPDSIWFGGPEIIEEFGVDDFELFYGQSVVSAGHGHILYAKIADDRLKMNAISPENDLMQFSRCFGVKIPLRDTNEFIDQFGSTYIVILSDDLSIKSIEYYALPL